VVNTADTGSPVPATDSSTAHCTSWPSVKSAPLAKARTTSKKLVEMKTPAEARRALKRRLTDAVYRRITKDQQHSQADT
jgi:hypothetical protein